MPARSHILIRHAWVSAVHGTANSQVRVLAVTTSLHTCTLTWPASSAATAEASPAGWTVVASGESAPTNTWPSTRCSGGMVLSVARPVTPVCAGACATAVMVGPAAPEDRNYLRWQAGRSLHAVRLPGLARAAASGRAGCVMMYGR